jgi:predicted O-methyltransferase YrrM
MDKKLLDAEIEFLETFNKQGESYASAEGRHGWRNPIRRDTGELLRCFVIAHNASRILEFGTGHGLSTLYLAAGLRDKSKQFIHSIEFDPEVADSSQERFNRCLVPVKVFKGDALEIIPQLEGIYDLVFFDAQKDQYYSQLMALLKYERIAKGTLILADNVLDRKTECQSFLDWFVEKGVSHYCMHTECGLLVARL